MNRYARAGLTASMLSLSLLLAACGTFDPSSFDPTSIFDLEIFNTKKKLPGKRELVFPEGTPGVPQGVPPELVKGYHTPEAPDAAAQQEADSKPEASPEAKVEAKPKPKPKPKPRLVAKPPEDSTPTAVTVRPSAPPPPAQPPPQSQPAQSQQVQWPAPPPTQPQAQQPAAAWPGAPPSAGAVAWPDPPATTPR
jgi:hypothetical protein